MSRLESARPQIKVIPLKNFPGSWCAANRPLRYPQRWPGDCKNSLHGPLINQPPSGLHFSGNEPAIRRSWASCTDGSESSLRAVDRAAAIAADHGAKLIVATAHLPVLRGKGPLRHPAGEHPRRGLLGWWARPPTTRTPAGGHDPGAQSRGQDRGGEVDRRCPHHRAGAPGRGGRCRPAGRFRQRRTRAASPGGCWDQSRPKSPARPRPTC